MKHLVKILILVALLFACGTESSGSADGEGNGGISGDAGAAGSGGVAGAAGSGGVAGAAGNGGDAGAAGSGGNAGAAGSGGDAGAAGNGGDAGAAGNGGEAGAAGSGGDAGAQGLTAFTADEVDALLSSTCGGCHGEGGAGRHEGLGYDNMTSQQVYNSVVPTSRERMPPRGPYWTSEQIERFRLFAGL